MSQPRDHTGETDGRRGPQTVLLTGGAAVFVLILATGLVLLLANREEPRQGSGARTLTPTPSASPSPTATATPTAQPDETPVATPEPAAAPDWTYVSEADWLGPAFIAADGTIYFIEAARDRLEPGVDRIVALDPSGGVLPGWPLEIGILPAATVHTVPSDEIAEMIGAPWTVSLAHDGFLHAITCGDAASTADCRLHRLGRDGQYVPGWPVDIVGDCTRPLATSERVYVACYTDDTTVTAFDAGGQMLPGWPASVEGLYPRLHRGSDGTVYVQTTHEDTTRTTVITALREDGSARPGWPITLPDNGDVRVTDDLVLTWWYEGAPAEVIDAPPCVAAEQTVFAAVGADGLTRAGWPYAVSGSASRPTIGPEGVITFTARGMHGTVVHALDADGQPIDGWPVTLPEGLGGDTGCVAEGPVIGADRALHMLGNLELGTVAVRLDADGVVSEGWPVQIPSLPMRSCWDCLRGDLIRPVVDQSGVMYFATGLPTGAGEPQRVEVHAVAADGSRLAGWPRALETTECAPPTCVTIVDSLALHPDGALIIRVSRQEHSSENPTPWHRIVALPTR